MAITVMCVNETTTIRPLFSTPLEGDVALCALCLFGTCRLCFRLRLCDCNECQGGQRSRGWHKGSPEGQQGGRSIIGVSTAAHKYWVCLYFFLSFFYSTSKRAQGATQLSDRGVDWKREWELPQKLIAACWLSHVSIELFILFYVSKQIDI